jgi:hypothetical protein
MLARVSLPHVSMAGGMTAAAQSLAYVIANPIVGRVVKRSGSYDGVLLVLGALVLPGAIAWALWPMSQRDGAPSSRASETGGSAAT